MESTDAPYAMAVQSALEEAAGHTERTLRDVVRELLNKSGVEEITGQVDKALEGHAAEERAFLRSVAENPGA
ncbi:hypothetical protein [Streptomyces sp. 5-10]|uniref:hypothetical protein n=1 Tax=Streptomyces sp. 5-10 TaxID=878925 RepID=UPI00168B141E|nr:hypothetical protein [Streptomyces sp. 5-10]MBD3004826.1 hypothetical protein [Streptomyces sp. 5-10]